jgi:hypothetical protein
MREMSEMENRKMKVYRDQLVTTDDLQDFKLELLSEIKALLQGSGASLGKKWMKSEEVRDMLGLSIGKLQTMRINGTLPYTKIGGVIYYDHQDIVNMMVSRKIQQ